MNYLVTQGGQNFIYSTFLDCVYTSLAMECATIANAPADVKTRILTASEEQNKEFCRDILNITSVKKVVYI